MPTLLTTLFHRSKKLVLALVFAALSASSGPVRAGSFFWDPDAAASGNNVDGTNLGGSGTWDSTTNQWWTLATLISWPNGLTDEAIFTSAYPALGLPTTNSVLLGEPLNANRLSFLRSGYVLSGSTLTLSGTTPGLRANLGESATIQSLIAGSGGLTLEGGGFIRLANNGNTYTGTTTISNGTLVVTGQGALGTDPSAIVISTLNPYAGTSNVNLRGFRSGSLFLDGTGGPITISRDLSLQGRGPIGDNGAALISSGNNTLSGSVEMGVAFNGLNVNTRIIAADGTLNLTGPLNILGTAATTISSFGGISQAGASFYNLTGPLSGTGTLEGSGGGTLFLNPSDSSGFSGTIRVSGSAASGQSVVRIDSAGVLGTRTNSTTGAVLDLNGGVLAILMDTPDLRVANGTNANVYLRASNSSIFADHTPNSSVRDQTVAFGNLSYEDTLTGLNFNSRNGYGMSFTTAPVNGGNGDVTFGNNLQGGALLSFNGNFWSNADNTGNRTMIFGGNGNTLINGSVIASSALFNHSLSKGGSGTLTITGIASTLDGNVNVNGGTLAINDWRSITNNGSTINIGSTTTAGTLSIVGNNVSLANLTTGKVINLAGTTGGATILANQTGTSPGLILNADFTATGVGSKTLTLGGANIGMNTINGAIVNASGASVTSLSKVDVGRWVLAGTNTYTGNTTISNGTLQLKANAAASTILADASGIVFGSVNNYAGGTLEFVGQPSTNNVETLGAITYASGGAATIKLSPGSGGTASLIFPNIGTGAGGTINFVGGDFTNNTFTINQINAVPGADGIITRSVYWNGADFAYRQGGVLRAPVYGVDATTATSATALTAARNNEMTGSFATNSVSVLTLKLNGGHTLTLNSGQTLTISAFGLLATGGSATITGGNALTVAAANTLVVRVNGGGDSLRIETPLSGFTGGLTKSGAGTLVLAGANTQTGAISIAEGTLRLASGGSLGGSSALTIRQDAILELNGVTPVSSTTTFVNNGIIRNTSATTDVTFTVGGANGTGDSRGIIEDGGVGRVSVVKIGTGGQNWLGLSTYTGTTTIGSTGIVGINNLQDGGQASGIGASGNAASNLIFIGESATQAYGGLNFTGTTNDETDRLFTFNGGLNGGVRIQSNGVNGATSSWTNTGALVFGTNATGNAQGLVLGGASTGDNRFAPLITNNGAAVTSVYKSDLGVWYLGNSNTYTGVTQINAGTLYVQDGVNLMKGAGTTGSNIILNGGSLAATGAFVRGIGTGGDQIRWTDHAAGGFSAGGTPLTVDLGTGNVWGSTPGFLGTGALLLNNSGVAKSDVDLISGFEITPGNAVAINATTTATSATVNLTSGSTVGLAIGQEITGNPNIPAGATIATIVSATQFTLNSATGVLAGTGVSTSVLAGGYRQINVGDFTSIGADFATISGTITGAGSLAKEGTGILNLRGLNSYTGQTLLRAGTLVVESLGLSSAPGSTSIGNSMLGNTNAGALILGNGSTGAGILEYVGPGETSDRMIRINTTTGSTQIHADGTGPLILTNVANDMAVGAKLFYLRGVNAGGNMITSSLSDNGGVLGVVVDGSATWILTNGANNYTGTTSVNGGALGIGHDTALGNGSTLSISNGTVFAYGGDRTIANPITQSATSGTIAGFSGDYSLNLTGLWTDPSTTSTTRFIRNNIVAGKTLTIGGNYIANGGTTSPGVGFDGSGDTIVNGIISSTMTNFGITYAGTGSLTLGGANTYTGRTTITSGTLRLGANEVIPHGAVNPLNNEVLLNPLVGVTATLDLNGKTETINGLTAITAGTAIIDNTSAAPASLTFGANNTAMNFGGGIGNFTIQNSGGGALSLTKTGSAAALISAGVNLLYTGSTTVEGGSLTIASAVNGTTALQVTGGSILALTGGITNPGTITSLEVGGGSTLSLLDGTGSLISNLSLLNLGNTGTGTATLNLNVGDGATDTLTLLTAGVLNLGNTITFNLTDAGLSAGTTYTMLHVVDGGLSSFGLGNFIQGATPGGFSGSTWNVTDNLVQLTTGSLIIGTSYWRGLSDNAWNGNANNWSQDKAGTVAALSTPGSGTDVIFAYNGVGAGPLVTTLEQNFKVNSLSFEAGTTTPASVTINPGTVTANRIEIAPQTSSDGIRIAAGGPSVVTISGAVRLGGLATSQTWEVADLGSVLSLGSLFGERDVTKSGLGKVTLTTAADPTFNSGATSTFTINAGTLEILEVSALGNAVNANLVPVTVNSSGTFYYTNVTAGTVGNILILNGGTLSAGGNGQTYSGPINVSGDSFINLRDSNTVATAALSRNITLSGLLSGSNRLTIRSDENVATRVGGNAEIGTLTINHLANTWNGELAFESGTVIYTSTPLTASNAGHTGIISFNQFGRIIFRNLNGETLNRTGALNFAANAIGELSVDNISAVLGADYLINQSGQVNIGSGAAVRFNLADAASSLTLTGGVVLGGNASISVEGGDADSFVSIPSVISDGGGGFNLAVNDDLGAWAATNTILRLTGANTFTGNVTLASGVLEFDTVTNASGGASALGNGTAINVSAGTLRFMGDSAQSTDRTITSTGVMTLSANGATSADTITYAGAITIGPVTDGSQIVLTGAAGREGIITGGITQTGDLADMTVNGGTWTMATATSRIGDVLNVSGADTILNLNSGLLQVRNDITVTTGAILNLNGTGVLSFSTATLSADASLRATTGGTINLGGNDAVVVTDFDGLRIGVDAIGIGTLNMGSFNQTVVEFILGNRNFDRSGVVDGTGTLTVTGNLDLYSGIINANLASTGTIVLEKIGAGTLTLRGDNSGLASTGATVVYDGILNLDFTANNNTKLRAASVLDLRGVRINLMGNNAFASTQTVGGLTMATGGSSTIQVTGGTGQDAVLNLGAITRGNVAQDGTLRLILPGGIQSASNGVTTTSPNSSFGMLGTGATATSDAAYATVEDSTGTWFATASGGNVVALTSLAKNDLTTWLAGDHISDETSGFTGVLQSANINSLRFNAAGGSDVVMAQGGVLIIGSGGFLITNNVGGTPSLMGGTLASGATELVITQDSTQPFEIGADIRINHAVTKTGTGTLTLSGNNIYTGATEIQEGVLRVTGNSIGDNSLVTLANSRNSSLELLASETIGRLSGGARATDGDYGVVAVGSHTLTINNSGGNTTYAGFFTGDGNIIKQGTHNLNLTNLSTGFTGVFTVDSGMLHLTALGQINASVIRINRGGAMIFDNNGTTTPSVARILDTTAITLNSADGTFNGQTIVRGLAIRNDNDATRDETVGVITLNTGASYLGMEATTTLDDSDIIMSDLVRLNNATLNVRGTNLGGVSSQENEFRIGDLTNQANFLANGANLVGGGGAAGTRKISIVPWAIGESTPGALTALHMGNSLVTYVSGSGFRPLDFTTEYSSIALATATDNARESISLPIAFTSVPARTINSLVLNNNSVTAATHAVIGAGAGESLAITSGALLFTLNPLAVAGNYGLSLEGFDSGITVGATDEYVIHVVNPDAGLPTKSLTATIVSPLTSAADITKSGRGTLVLSGNNTAGGGLKKTTINEGTLEIADLDNIGGDTGSLVFAGGILRLAAGFTDDLSLRLISLLDAGGTLDTNGNSLVLANSVGSGLGGFTKAGAGDLILNAAATYTGATTISGGVLTIGANNATGIGGALNLVGASTLALGTNSITAGLVTISGANPVITGKGTINASGGFFFNNTGNNTVEANLAGPGGLFKAQTNILTLTGASTYTGTTEVQSGTLAFDTISLVGGGASALGAPTTVTEGMVRMGLTTTATSLTYTGIGSTTDRIIEMQGTTGGVTINANGTGALALGRIQTATNGNKTLTLRGTSAPSLVNSVGEIREVGSILTLNKTDANTWQINQASRYSGDTQIDNGTLLIGVNDALPVGTTVRLGSGATAATLDLNGFNQTIAALESRTSSTTLTNQLIIGSGTALTVTGNVIIGANTGAGATTLFTASGGGSFINNQSGGTFQIGGATGTINTNAVSADFSGLSDFTVNLGSTGIFNVGDVNTNTSGGPSSASTLTLATTSSITAGTLNIGGATGQGNAVQTLRLGSGTTGIQADTINIGGNTSRSGGALVFAGTSGTVVIRGADGTGAAVVNMVNGSVPTAITNATSFLLAGHQADVMISTMTMAAKSVSTGLTSATFSFDQGNLEIGTLVMTANTGVYAGTAESTVNLGGGDVAIGNLNMAVNTSSGAGSTALADLTVTGGNVAIGDGLNTGTAINMGHAATARTVTSTINLTGGSVVVSGDIVRTGGGGVEDTTITLDGGTLDMSTNEIGSALKQIAFVAQSGTLRNLGELNGGGALDKTTAGTLILDTSNDYTGATTVTAGVLRISHGNALGGTTAGTTVADGAALELSGAITTTNEALTLNGSGVGDGGALRSSAGNNTYAGNITLATASRINADVGLLTLDATSGPAIVGVNQNLTLGGAGNLTVVDAIQLGTGTLVKDGSGTVILSGNDSRSGSTTVREGMLQINGNSALATGAVTVDSGATLGGSGTIGGAGSTALIASGGILTGGSDGSTFGSPGLLNPLVTDAVGSLSFGGSLTAAAGSIWLVDLVQGGTSDLINVGGGLDLSGANLGINFGGAFVANQIYTIATYGTGLTGNFSGLSEGAFVDPGNLYRINYGTLGGAGAITLTAVPEPGTLALLGLALGGLFLRRIRRRHVSAVSSKREG